MRIVDDARELSEEEFREWGALVSPGFPGRPTDSTHGELISGEIVDQDGEIEELREEVDSGTCKRKDPGDHVRRAELLHRFAPLIAKSAALQQCAPDGGPPRKKA